MVSLLKKETFRAEGVYAEDPERNEKVNRFRKSKLEVLVTTTILERGVTVKKAQVGVLGQSRLFFRKALLSKWPAEPAGILSTQMETSVSFITVGQSR